jgi:cytochrome c553
MLPLSAHADGKQKAAALAGAALFHDKGCAHCHGEAGVGGKKGPTLTTLRKDKLWTPAKIKDQILKGGQKMPPFADSITDEEAAQLIAYLRAKKKPVARLPLQSNTGALNLEPVLYLSGGSASRAMRPLGPTTKGSESAFQLPLSSDCQLLPSSRLLSEPFVPTVIHSLRDSEYCTAER